MFINDECVMKLTIPLSKGWKSFWPSKIQNPIHKGIEHENVDWSNRLWRKANDEDDNDGYGDRKRWYVTQGEMRWMPLSVKSIFYWIASVQSHHKELNVECWWSVESIDESVQFADKCDVMFMMQKDPEYLLRFCCQLSTVVLEFGPKE